MKINPPEREKQIEKAITLLVKHVIKKCRNPKPLILHSIRVGIRLIELNKSKETIIAGILHDIIEDTNCKISEIRKEFGLKVANLVFSLTQEDIIDYKKRWGVLLKKIKKEGKEAMLIKILDSNDNLIHYFRLIKDKKTKEETLWKYHFTIKSLKPYIGNTKAFKEYLKNYNSIKIK